MPEQIWITVSSEPNAKFRKALNEQMKSLGYSLDEDGDWEEDSEHPGVWQCSYIL